MTQNEKSLNAISRVLADELEEVGVRFKSLHEAVKKDLVRVFLAIVFGLDLWPLSRVGQNE